MQMVLSFRETVPAKWPLEDPLRESEDAFLGGFACSGGWALAFFRGISGTGMVGSLEASGRFGASGFSCGSSHGLVFSGE